MLSVSDFESGPALAQAALVGIGAAMSWRGLHLSGDRGWFKLLWGAVSIGSFFGALLIGAWGNHDSLQSVSSAEKSRVEATQRLTDIQQTLSKMNSAMSKIAGAAELDPNQSVQSLADQVINKISSMQAKLNQTNSRVDALEHPPPDPNTIYQNGKNVGDVIRGTINTDAGTVTFTEIDNAGNVDFSRPIEIRSYTLVCPATPFTFLMGTSPITHRWATSVLENVTCTIQN